ncbi:hypothetical protein EV361DRAFT_76173 [Lentinula raphanica]|uniref:F-box domain-containing protein n=1 Tax=Lentinula raphanica TaxID=153919 RepID=A0AA38PEP4_9AGAR|nr:hypothetical protein F5878DRAFT_708062 [Lentinula raphanica]KAJ3977273.1 hypothetical protein EV361DRAFT_76173 [Lentinula raphanica]
MSFTILPLELLDAVCESLSPLDLAHLSYTCTSVHQSAQRQLYRHLSISSSRRNLSVVLTLARKPHLAHYVRSFSIELDIHCSTLLRPFYSQLSRALSGMAELSSLQLSIDSTASWVLAGIKLPRLVQFACPFPVDSYISNFLKHTPALLELEVDSTSYWHEPPIAVLAPSSAPLLQHFVGSSRAAKAIVPSRPVQSVQLTAGDLTEEVVSRLSESTAGISIFSARTNSAPAILLQLLSQKLQCLVHIRLLTTYSYSETHYVTFYQHIAGALNAFPDLQTFELSGMHWGSEERKDSDRQRVWQSQPFEFDLNSSPESLDIDPYSDLFYAY